MTFSANHENRADPTATHNISIEEARSAAAAINEYMANWSNLESCLHGARVMTLGGFRGTYYGKDRILWVVSRWDRDLPIAFLLFQQGEDGRVLLTSGDEYFLEGNLYPEAGQQSNEAGAQEGGAL